MSILWSRPSYSQVQLGRTDWVVWVCAGFPNWNMKWRNAIDTCPKTVKFINFYLKFVSLFLTFRHLKFLAVFSWSYTRHNGTLFFNCKDACPGGGGGTPYKGLYRGAQPGRGTFFRLQVYEREGILLVEVDKRAGKSVISVCERAQMPNRWILWLYKVEETFYFCDWLLSKRQCIYSS